MRAVLVSLGSLIVAAACQDPAGQPDYSAVFDGSGGRWIDLSYAYSEETLYGRPKMVSSSRSSRTARLSQVISTARTRSRRRSTVELISTRRSTSLVAACPLSRSHSIG